MLGNSKAHGAERIVKIVDYSHGAKLASRKDAKNAKYE